jgi:SecD/SecF fusion protein
LNVFPAKKNNATASYLLYSRDFIKQQQTRDEEGKQVEYYMLTRVSPVDSFRVTNEIRLVNVRSTTDDEQRPAVGFSFNPAGSAKLGAMTERNRPTDAMLRSMAIVMDDKIVTAPTLNVVLRDGGIISGSFKQNEVNRLVNILRSGNLNADLKPDPVSENTIGATLGESTIRKGLISVAGAFIAVLIFMVIYYKFSGLIASTALLVNLVMTVGFMIAVSAAFTLPGLAGLVLMLGMAVDANVLIFERVREEREKGGTLAASIRLGYDRAFGTIIDTHLTSIFTCLVLYTFGNDNLKGFAVSLTLGLLISLLTSLYMTRLIFEFWLHKRWMTEYKPLKMLSKPSINFMAIRRQMFLLTAVLTMTGLVLFLSRGERVLNVDFTKGTAYGGRLREGEERPLSSSGDKKGMLELLGTDRQNERLKVKEVIWRSESAEVEQGEGSTRTVSENIYELIYEDGSRAIVTLANVPEGATKEEQLANLKQRASGLPDVSVEQVFLQGDDFSGGAARSFTIRTTEREPELVQVVLDRLLRDDANRPLLQTSRITSRVLKGSTLTVTFDTPTSPGYFKRFVERQVRLALADRSQFFKSADIEVRGVPTEVPEAGKASPDDIAAKQKQASEEGRTSRYQTIEVKFGGIIEFKALDNPATKPETKAELERVLNGALDEAQKAFEERPIPDRLETFDPALAKDTQNKAFQAILLSWLAILVYLWFRFGSWTFGLAAVLCLIHDLAFTLGAIALCHYAHDTLIGQFLQLQDFKIDLAAVAALLTLVGFSVNDTIVVFDRIREVRGKNPALTEQMINDSMNQTLSRTILSTTTVFLVVLVLYFFGGEGVHLFAFVMVTGVIVGTFSSIYVAAPLLLLLGEGKHRPTNTTEAIPVPAMPSATTS